MKPDDKRKHNKGRPMEAKQLRYRARVQELIEELGGTWKTSDLAYDIEIRDMFSTTSYLSNQLGREMTRLLQLGQIRRLPTKGWYRVNKDFKPRKSEEATDDL